MTIQIPVYMNNAFTGYSKGTYGAYIEDRVPSQDPLESDYNWIKGRWLGFIRYPPRSGMLYDKLESFNCGLTRGLRNSVRF